MRHIPLLILCAALSVSVAHGDLPGSKPSSCSERISALDCNELHRVATLPAEYQGKYRIADVREIIGLPSGEVRENEAAIRFEEIDPHELPRRLSAWYLKKDGSWTRQRIVLSMNNAMLSGITFETGERIWRFLKNEARLLDGWHVTNIYANRDNRIKPTKPSDPPVRYTVGLQSDDQSKPAKEKKRILYIAEEKGKLSIIENFSDETII